MQAKLSNHFQLETVNFAHLFSPDTHQFLNIPVNSNYSTKTTTYFQTCFHKASKMLDLKEKIMNLQKY